MSSRLSIRLHALARGTTRFLAVVAVLALGGLTLGACDETGPDGGLDDLDSGGAIPLSSLLGAGSELEAPDIPEVDRWVQTVDRELSYANALEAHWTDQVRDAVMTATAARRRAETAEGIAREAAVAEAREVLDAVPWSDWSTTLIACVDHRISADDVAQARDSRSGKDPAWQARVRRADRLRKGADEAMREGDARRSLQRAFYACELASQVAGEPLTLP